MSLMQNMLTAGVHYGHKKQFWNPEMKQYIFGVNHGIHIINLEKTVPLFEKAINYIKQLTDKNGKILFVGTKRQARQVIVEESQRCGMPYVNHRWLGGMLTNYKTIRQSIKRLKTLEQEKKDGIFEQLTKKEALYNEKAIAKLEKTLGGIKDMAGLPDAIVIIDSKEEHIAITEAKRLGIKVIAIVDSNADPKNIDYVIPGNDDAIKSIKFYLNHFANAIIDIKKANPN